MALTAMWKISSNKNVVQDRVTDHRLGMSVKNLAMVMDGEGLRDFIKALQERHHDETLEAVLSDQ